MVEKALSMANAGATMEEILRTLEECRDNCHSYLIVQDFDFLRRGGRLTPVAAKFASALNVKPIMEQVEEGTRLSIHGVARTIKGAAKNIKSQLEKRNVGEGYLISISHARAEKDAQEIAAVMRETFAKAKVEILDLSPAFITQGGPGCIAVQYVKM
jgi:DegV family protein with EDD domain